jgi:hypothetical protein
MRLIMVGIRAKLGEPLGGLSRWVLETATVFHGIGKVYLADV